MSREVPEGWESTTLGAVGRWFGGGTPSKKVSAYWSKRELPWVSPKDVKSDTITDAEDWISADAIRQSATNVVPEGGILIVTRSGILRHSLPIARCARDCAINQDIKALVVRDKCHGPFVFQYARGVADEIRRRCVKTGTTVESVDFEALKQFPILLPTLAEQRRIAEILSSVDEAIQTTQAVIEQLCLTRRTLLSTLFPLNISDLGDRFAGWEVKPADRVTSAIIDCKNRTPPRSETGFAVVRTPNVRDGQFVRHGLHYTDLESFVEWTKKGKPTVGDVLFTREAPFGQVCLCPADIEVCLGQRMMLFRPNQKEISSDYLLYAIQSEVLQQYMIAKAGGSTVGHLRVADVRSLPIPYPPLPLQAEIAGALTAVDAAIRDNQGSVAHLGGLKAALMSDLLTGRKRVTADLPLAAE